jgi:DNA polymerase I-like protein with 3'-5' exonuclease and polymerase domains
VQSDLSAIEPTIIAEFSQDPTLLKLYGPTAKPNDVYLFNGAHISVFAAKIRAIYDPENPTPEDIARAKKEFKKERNILKTVTLACGYGASVKRVHQTLVEAGIDISFADVRRIHQDYWQLYAGIRSFQRQLEAMHEQLGGFIMNATGRPMAIPNEFLHDAVNRFAQSSGHDVLQVFIWHTNRLRLERQLEAYPWIPDWHDEQIWEVPEQNADAMVELLRDAIDATNAELGMSVVIKAEPQIADNLAAIKCE